MGLLLHIGEDNPFCERLVALAGELEGNNPWMPFKMIKGMDLEFRD